MNMEKWETEHIDVEKIMKEIKEKVRRRKETSTYYTRNIDILNTSSEKYNPSPDINFINGRSTIGNYFYLIDSHRGLFGKLLVKGRELIHGEVKRYVDPIFLMQSEWNTAAAHIIRENDLNVSNIESRLRILEEQISNIQRIKKFYDNTYEELTEEKLRDTISIHEYLIDIIQSYALKSAGERKPKIIEIGIENGAISIYLSKNFNFDIYGTDSSIDSLFYSLKNNEKLGGKAIFFLSDFFNLHSLKDKYFDVAFSQSTLDHYNFQSIIKLLSNQKNIANFVIFSINSVCTLISNNSTKERVRINDLHAHLINAGFNVLLLEYYQDDHYIIGIIGE